MKTSLTNEVADFIKGESHYRFDELCLMLFIYQYENIPVYHQYVNSLKITPKNVKSVNDIPFLPVEFFKTHEVKPLNVPHQIIFSSSGTTGTNTANHFVVDKSIYDTSFLSCFKQFYGNPQEYVIAALLPSYLEREGSSLVYMVKRLIEETQNAESSFYLSNKETLKNTIIRHAKANSDKTFLLIGVTYALLDFAQEVKDIEMPQHLVVMETGGMKGRRKEMIREEVHEILEKAFGVSKIHSEYGMTELLSQAYSKGKGIFESPSWMKIFIRDSNDPFSIIDEGKTGGINIIDMANVNSCSFIATQDLGKLHTKGTFEVLGRFDNSDVRGCNLLL